MLQFQKTKIYRDAISAINDLLGTLVRKKKDLMVKIVEAEAVTLTTALTKGLSENNEEAQKQHFAKASRSILSLISLMDVAGKSINRSKSQALTKQFVELIKNIKDFRKNRKKVIILTCEMGKAHIIASNAIADAIAEIYGYDYDVELIDFMEFMDAALNIISKKTYEGSVKFMPFLYKLYFDSTDRKWPIKALNNMNYPFVIKKLKKFFEDKKPDIIVSTFPLWDYITSETWRKYNNKAKFISVITDSTTIHKSWVTAKVDFHVVCNEDTALVLKKYGIKRSKIKVLGFPVRLEFTKKPDRKEFMKKHSLDAEKQTILFLSAAQNPKKNVEIMKNLMQYAKNFNIIVITGRDSGVTSKLEKIAKKTNVRIFKWTDEMPSFIQNSDVVITKAGGATVMECIAAEKPIIITSVIPGQEMGNADLITKNSLGIVLKDIKALPDAINKIFKNYGQYRKNLKKLSRPDAAIKIAEFIYKLTE